MPDVAFVRFYGGELTGTARYFPFDTFQAGIRLRLSGVSAVLDPASCWVLPSPAADEMHYAAPAPGYQLVRVYVTAPEASEVLAGLEGVVPLSVRARPNSQGSSFRMLGWRKVEATENP